jgi:EAL and modified HD-GYP domain-containing signal transduction protein
MVGKGYEIALDDFFFKSRFLPLIALSKFVKLDFRLAPMEEIADCVRKLSSYPVKLVAEKVETHEEFSKALEMGFEYFQGYFFCKPQILKGQDISPSKLSLLQIMAEANKADFNFGTLEKIIARDVSISYKLLRYLNSAYFKRVQEISSIKQAIVLLGETGIRRFLSLIIMAKLASDKPDELVRTSIIRARLCELVGKSVRVDGDCSRLFMLGLFSVIDGILDDDMEKLVENLPLSDAVKTALVKGKGPLANYLKVICSYEKGDWSAVAEASEELGVKQAELPKFYVDAVSWADSIAFV